MEFTESLGLAGVAFVALIIGVIQAAKRFFPNAHDNVWFGTSLLLGVVFQVAFWYGTLGWPQTFLEWLTLVTLGVAFGLSAGKTYDEQKARRNGNA